MSKRQTDLQRIEDYKKSFQALDTDKIKKRLKESTLKKDAQIALKEILKERETR